LMFNGTKLAVKSRSSRNKISVSNFSIVSVSFSSVD
jgi:hypothetical protein